MYVKAILTRWNLARLFSPEADAGGGSGTAGGGGTESQADPATAIAFERDKFKAEAQKLKKQVDEFKGKVPTDEQLKRWADLEEAQAKAEEDRKKKAGEFDSLRESLVKKHEQEKAELSERVSAAETRLRNTLIAREFAGATKLFGGVAESKTVLTHDVAQAYLSRYVTVETDEDGHDRVIVNDTSGHPILNAKTGQPAAFAEAMEELILSLPNKDTLLRGSGKTGSGSAGGGTGHGSRDIDFSHLTPDDFKDPKVQAAIKSRTAKAGGLVMGSAWDRMARK